LVARVPAGAIAATALRQTLAISLFAWHAKAATCVIAFAGAVAKYRTRFRLRRSINTVVLGAAFRGRRITPSAPQIFLHATSSSVRHALMAAWIAANAENVYELGANR